MDRLWAPWRMAYIEVAAPPGCVFCGRAEPSGEAADRERLILLRGRTCFITLNLYPYNNGHLMVAPYRHTADLPALARSEQDELMSLTRYCVRVLQHALRPDGFNIGMNLGRSAGAGIADHLHMHVVPRWNGDTNFMPVLGETRVLPEALFPSYDRLAAACSELGPPEDAA
jgi:ATP adenylyltransferase